MIVSKSQVGLGVLAGLILIAGFFWLHHANTALRDETAHQRETRLQSLREQVANETKRAAAAEARLNVLLAEAKTLSASPPARTVVENAADALKALIERGTKLSAEEKYDEALSGYLAFYRELRESDPTGREIQSLMSAIRTLGRKYPTAVAALEKLRDTAVAERASNPKSTELVTEIMMLNDRLNAGASTVALYDSLAPDHPMRSTVARMAQKSLIQSRRYADAMIGRPFAMMLSTVEAITRQAGQVKGDPQAFISGSVTTITADIEVLTGVENTEGARRIEELLLAFDGSAATRAAIEQAKVRAQAPR